MVHGGRVLVEQLRAEGIRWATCVPGESYLAALDGLHDANDIRTIVCRQEGGAAIMAEAFGKVTGQPGVAFVTRGPGATNASIGVHIAQQDSTPMVLFVGQAARSMLDREAFQEVDFGAMFAPLAKWSAEISDTDRIPEYVSRAMRTAMSGRPGPVVLSLPEDMLSDECSAMAIPPSDPAECAPSPRLMEHLEVALKDAQRPLVIAGGPGWSQDVADGLARFAERFNLPVAVAFRFQDRFDNRHPNYAGHVGIGIDPTLAEHVREADLILVVGPRLGEITTSGYTLLSPPSPACRLVHVHPGAEELGSVYRADIPIQASLPLFVTALDNLEAPENPCWQSWTDAACKGYAATLEPLETPGRVKMEQIVTRLSDTLDENAIVANGAGNYATWVHRYFRYKRYGTQLAPTAGAMGYGLPAAIAAKLHDPRRTVVAFAGDGCFMMNSQELATAVKYGVNVVTLVVNNGMYGTIRMHQARSYPGRQADMTLTNPDFAAYARSFGAFGATVEDTADFDDAFAEAVASNKPAVIELKIDPEAITPRQTLSEIEGL